ncbi:amino acid transporter AVT1H [Pyrus x bretschneideri]|uniref:amino acid transporter AVT1H n=1 Tax=Pyrus x bretschneideri TaxID=225117 RepID=UPI00202E25E4|nr:amino acid transporter AVT1H [Pyrus x bretschneideri]
MNMWNKLFGTSRSNCLPHQNQVLESDAVQRANLSCNVCLEENKVCTCDQSFESGKRVTGVVEHHAEANNSVIQSVVNMSGMLIGLGQLSTPYALENGGWSSAFLLIGLGVICAYCSHLLGKCLDKHPKSRSYTDIGYNAFGSRGKIIAASFIYVEIFMALVSYTIALHDNLATVLSGIQLKISWAKLQKSQLLTLIAVFVALPSLWLRDLSSISFLSFGGVLMSLVIFISVACTAIFGGVKLNHTIPALQIHNIPAISGLYSFSFAGHVVFPNLYKAMKDPSKFTKVSIISFTLVTILYASLGFTGAKLFGPQVNPQITLSMPPHLIVTKIALWATVLTPMTKYALEFAPMAIQLEHNLPPSLSSRAKFLIRGSVGSVLLLVILALALSVPYFGYVLSLTGSLVSVGICIILPCAFYLKICWGQISRPLMVLNLTLIAFGTLLGIAGTISSSRLLFKSLSRAHSA